jgi:hypothetical protein
VTTEGDSARAPHKDPDGAELTVAATTADTGAPDPHILVEAKRSHNWPHRDKPIEAKPAARMARPVAQGLSKPGVIDHVDTHAKVARVAANPGHAHWEAVKRTLHHFLNTHDPPFAHIEASSPYEGYANTNADAASSTAEDRRAIPERALPIDGGTTPPFSKPQDIAVSPTSGSGHVAATLSDKEASWLRSPDPGLFGGLKGPTTTFSTTTAALAPTRDRHHQHLPHQVLGDDPTEAPDEAPASSERDCSSSPDRRRVDAIASRTPFPSLTRSPASFLFQIMPTTHIDVHQNRTLWTAQEKSTCSAYHLTDDAMADAPTGPLLPAKEWHFAASLGLRAE